MIVPDHIVECLVDYNTPSLFAFTSRSGHVMHGMMIKPRDFQPDRKYPTVLYVYGGPQVQIVTNTFKGFRCVCKGFSYKFEGFGYEFKGLRMD